MQENVFPQPETNGNQNQNQNQGSAPTERPVQTASEMPNWMQLALDEHSTSPKPNAQVNQMNTTPQPGRTTTINSFWTEWSATNPPPTKTNGDNSNFNQGSNSNKPSESIRQTTTEKMPDWMKEVVNEFSTTTSKTTTRATTVPTTTKPELLPWMKDILNEHQTTAKPSVNHNNQVAQTTTTKPDTEAEMPSWMRDVLNEVSTTTALPAPFVVCTSTTKRPTLNSSSSFIGGGDSSDLHVTTQNRYSMCESLCLSTLRIHCRSCHDHRGSDDSF